MFSEKKILSYLKFNLNQNTILLNNIFSSFVFKGLALLIQVIMMPYYLKYFESPNYLGLWFIIISILNIIILFDFGIGNGIRNELIKNFTKNDKENVNYNVTLLYAASFFISLSFLSMSVLCLFIFKTAILEKFDFQFINRFNEIFIISIIFVALQIFLRSIVTVLNSLQKTAFVNFLFLISNTALFIYLVFDPFNHPDEDKIIALLTIYFIVNTLPLAIMSMHIFKKEDIKVVKSAIFDISRLKIIFKSGGNFFYTQILFLLLLASNEMLIGYFYNFEDVVRYQVLYKVFYTFATLFSLFSSPIWSAVVKARNEDRVKWIKHVFWILNTLAFFSAVLIFLVSLYINEVLDIWLGADGFEVSMSESTIFLFFTIFMILNFTITTFANAYNALKYQIVGYGLMLVLKIPLIYILNLFNPSWINVLLSISLLLIPYLTFQYIGIYKLISNEKENEYV